MKSAIEQISEDLDWRESELASMRLLLRRPGNSPVQERALLRGAWALLYAHYEGFIKFSLTVFYEEAANRATKCDDLPGATKIYALKAHLKRLRNLSPDQMLRAIETFKNGALEQAPVFSEVDTQSNLWPAVLSELLCDADIHCNYISEQNEKLRTLVARRNAIAHGQKNMIEEIDYYVSYEDVVYNVMYDIALLIDDRLKSSPYSLES